MRFFRLARAAHEAGSVSMRCTSAVASSCASSSALCQQGTASLRTLSLSSIKSSCTLPTASVVSLLVSTRHQSTAAASHGASPTAARRRKSTKGHENTKRKAKGRSASTPRGTEEGASPQGKHVSSGSAAAAESSSSSEAASEAAAGRPWDYDTVNATTGKTSLEERFDAATQKVRDIFAQPIPELPSDDGSIEPDLLVGFAYYNFRLRDQYRAVIAKSLGLHPSEVELSVGWSGRFDVSRFSNCQKVCGVRIKQRDDAAEEAKGERTPLSSDVLSRIDTFVHSARKRSDEALLNLHIIKAATALKEVQFSARNTQVEGVLQYLRDDVKLFSLHQVVILHNDTSSELQWVESRAAKVFRDRKVIPHVVSLRELCRTVAVAAAECQSGNAVNANLQPLCEPKLADQPNGGPTNGVNHLSHVKTIVLAALSRACSEGVVRFPAVFCNGTHVGSIPQLTYLTKNTHALDAILLRPNDISVAKKFVSQLEGGRRRQMTLASEAAHAGTGKVHQ